MFLCFRHRKPTNNMGCTMKTSMVNLSKSIKIRTLICMSFIAITFFSLEGVNAKTIHLEIGGAQILKFDGGVSEVFIANPAVADVQLSNRHAAYIFGKEAGTTKIFAMDEKGHEVLNAEVVITHNLSNLKEMISSYDPHELVEIRSVPGGLLIEGMVDSPKTAENIVTLAEKFFEKISSQSSSTGSNRSSTTNHAIINRLTIRPPVQVNLRVKVAEVKRTVLNQLNFNWQAVFANIGKFNFAALTGRSPITGSPTPANNVIATNTVTSLVQAPLAQGPNAQSATISNTLGANFLNSHANINLAIDALSQDGLITILAEPNLVAVSGETASFLAGGEFPYPIPQQFGQVTIDFKQYGVSLAFTPTVLDGNLISLRVRPEVSELDFTTGTTVLGTTVPGILTRRAETTIQLGSGETFAIAGLLKNTVGAEIAALPGLGDLPILGALFRSNSFVRGDSELVILVTPYLVEPSSGKEMLLPTDGMDYATFVEQIFERRLLKPGVQKGQAPAFGPGGVRLMGPAGFSVE